MTAVRIIHAADLVARPWKNGQGVTWEIAIDPPGAGLGRFRWRVSRARIEADGPFSLFPGCERWIVCADGKGFALAFEDGAILPVPPARLVAFPGDRPVTCRLVDGPCTDVNVIARRELPVRAELVAAPSELPTGIGSALRLPDEVLVRLDGGRALHASFAPGGAGAWTS